MRTLAKEIGMKMMKALALTSLLALGGTAAWAQAQAPASPPAAGTTEQAAPRERGRAPLSRADVNALTDARIAGIQAGLKLNSEQQRLWGPVEQALRAAAADRAERMETRRERRDESRPDLMQRLERRAEMSSKRAEHATALATAMKPLWASLDDDQKRLLPILMRQDRMMGGHGRHMRHAMHHGGWRDAMHDRMRGPDGSRSPQQDQPQRP
jgi:hypothetical protein